MVGQATGYSPLRRHHKDIRIAIVVASEGDPVAVRRKIGKTLQAFVCRQTSGIAPVTVHYPDVIRIDEGNLSPA